MYIDIKLIFVVATLFWRAVIQDVDANEPRVAERQYLNNIVCGSHGLKLKTTSHYYYKGIYEIGNYDTV